MRETSWAIEVEPRNFQAIMSEAAREFNREFLERWHNQPDVLSGGGYFVRDLERPSFNCKLMTTEDFFNVYKYDQPPTCTDVDCEGAHFRPIVTLGT